MKIKYKKYTKIYMSYLEKLHNHKIGFWNTELRDKLYLGFYRSFQQRNGVEK